MNFQFNFGDTLTNMGSELARTASQHDEEAQKLWEQTKLLLVMASGTGMLKEAYNAIFEAGTKVQSRKALWYRRQKRLFKQLIDMGIDFRNMDMIEAQEAVKVKHEASKSKTQRRKDSLRMLERAMKGAVNVAPTERIIESIQRAAAGGETQQ